MLENLPVVGVVVASLLGWVTGSIACHSLCVRAPSEVAVYRATDPLDLRFITRPFYIISLAVAFIVVRYAQKTIEKIIVGEIVKASRFGS